MAVRVVFIRPSPDLPREYRSYSAAVTRLTRAGLRVVGEAVYSPGCSEPIGALSEVPKGEVYSIRSKVLGAWETVCRGSLDETRVFVSEHGGAGALVSGRLRVYLNRNRYKLTQFALRQKGFLPSK